MISLRHYRTKNKTKQNKNKQKQTKQKKTKQKTYPPKKNNNKKKKKKKNKNKQKNKQTDHPHSRISVLPTKNVLHEGQRLLSNGPETSKSVHVACALKHLFVWWGSRPKYDNVGFWVGDKIKYDYNLRKKKTIIASVQPSYIMYSILSFDMCIPQRPDIVYMKSVVPDHTAQSDFGLCISPI